MKPPEFRYRLVGGPAPGRTLRLPCLIQSIEVEPNGEPNAFLRRRECYYLVRLDLPGRRGVLVAESRLATLRASQDIRRDIATYIALNVAHFRLCEICAVIHPREVVAQLPYCPFCHGYRFTDRPAAIRHRATIAATTPPLWLVPHFGF